MSHSIEKTTLWNIWATPGLPSLPLLFRDSGSLLPTHSNHLNQAGGGGKGRLLTHLPTAINHLRAEQKEQQGPFPERQAFSWSLRLNPALNWHPIEGRLSSGWGKEGAMGWGNGVWEPSILLSSRTQSNLGQNVQRVLKPCSHPENSTFHSQQSELQVRIGHG